MSSYGRNFESNPNYQKIIQTVLCRSLDGDYSHLTVRDICRRAGISVGTFYYYFDSKEELFAKRIEADNRNLAEDLSRQLQAHTPLEQLSIYTDFYLQINLDCGVEDLKLVLSTDARWFTTRHPITVLLDRILADGQASGDFSSELPPEELADLFSGMLRGQIYNWCMSGGEFDLSTRLKRTLRVFLRAIMAPL